MTTDSALWCDDAGLARPAALTRGVPPAPSRTIQHLVQETRHECRDHRSDPALRPHHGGGGGGPAGWPGGVRAAGPERRGQDLAASDDGHGGRADIGPAAAAPPRPQLLLPTAGDPAPARLPAAEPWLLPGVHRGRVRRVLRAAEGNAAGADPGGGGGRD